MTAWAAQERSSYRGSGWKHKFISGCKLQIQNCKPESGLITPCRSMKLRSTRAQLGLKCRAAISSLICNWSIEIIDYNVLFHYIQYVPSVLTRCYTPPPPPPLLWPTFRGKKGVTASIAFPLHCYPPPPPLNAAELTHILDSAACTCTAAIASITCS